MDKVFNDNPYLQIIQYIQAVPTDLIKKPRLEMHFSFVKFVTKNAQNAIPDTIQRFLWTRYQQHFYTSNYQQAKVMPTALEKGTDKKE